MPKHFFPVLLLLLYACGQPSQKQNSVKEEKKKPYNAADYAFPTIEFNGKIWMAKNLNVDHYRDGSPIPEARTQKEWDSCFQNRIGCWCYFNNDTALGKIYGRMYNSYAISAFYELAPEGWHIAYDDDWNEFEYRLGGRKKSGGALKSTGTLKEKTGLWVGKNKGATNKTGFTALPGGWRDENAQDRDTGYYALFWTSIGNVRMLDFASSFLERQSINSNNYGYYVRCVKNNY